MGATRAGVHKESRLATRQHAHHVNVGATLTDKGGQYRGVVTFLGLVHPGKRANNFLRAYVPRNTALARFP